MSVAFSVSDSLEEPPPVVKLANTVFSSLFFFFCAWASFLAGAGLPALAVGSLRTAGLDVGMVVVVVVVRGVDSQEVDLQGAESIVLCVWVVGVVGVVGVVVVAGVEPAVGELFESALLIVAEGVVALVVVDRSTSTTTSVLSTALATSVAVATSGCSTMSVCSACEVDKGLKCVFLRVFFDGLVIWLSLWGRGGCGHGSGGGASVWDPHG